MDDLKMFRSSSGPRLFVFFGGPVGDQGVMLEMSDALLMQAPMQVWLKLDEAKRLADYIKHVTSEK